MASTKQNKEKLALWQSRLSAAQTAFDDQVSKMDEREAIYRGSKEITAVVSGDKTTETPHVRNIVAENIESCVDSGIPKPKVTARRQEDEELARLIEDMLIDELDRLPFETMNDQMERTVPIQGGGFFLVEWDNTERTHTTVGELLVSVIHPKQVVPQDGVYTSIEDMDYIILKLPQTKEYIKSRYKVDVKDEAESEPEIKGTDDAGLADDLVTQYVAYYRNEDGGIGLYSWCNDITLEDLEDYQARRLRRCAVCGALEPAGDVQPMTQPTTDGTYPVADGGMPLAESIDMGTTPARTQPTKSGKNVCPYCGSNKWVEQAEEYEELTMPVTRTDGSVIQNTMMEDVITDQYDDYGLPIVAQQEVAVQIPYYKPNIFPIILQRNVSVFGQLLGDSDIDKIRDQQNTVNRLEAKIIEKLVKSGSYVTLPPDATIRIDTEDMKTIRLTSAADKSMIDVINVQADISSDLTYLAQVYEESRQIIGVTDSFQGRRDTTATSGKAKEFSAAQAAGRLESKRIMKDAAYAALFEAMFKFKLAYTDEPRPLLSHDIFGNTEYKEWNKYDFLKQDDAGQWYWNDQFLFSCDTTTAPLSANREAMWQETRMNLQTGAFGDPAAIDTLILFWSKMEMLHYPGAGETKQYLEGIKEQQMAQAQMQQAQMMQAQMQQAQAAQQAQMQAQQEQQMQQAQRDEIFNQVMAQAEADAQAQQPMI